MVSFCPRLGSVVVSHQHGNTQHLKGCDHSMMTLSTEIFSFTIIWYTKLSVNSQQYKSQ